LLGRIVSRLRENDTFVQKHRDKRKFDLFWRNAGAYWRCTIFVSPESEDILAQVDLLVNQPRGTQRYRPTPREDEDALTRAIVDLASQYGRYGYRRITALLRDDGWRVSKDRVERIWRREGLKVPQRQKPRGRLWLNDGSCVRGP
jgi:hypothetical protein